jgi:4-amino-4-deoxy-L-arabinose transferase-like glycosyltransferase
MYRLTKSISLPFWLLTLTAVSSLVISQLVQDGMFMDGMIYVTVSRNLAEGLGSFWDPYFSATFMTSYHEQPPLYFGLLALFFKVFGSSMYVERLFSLVSLASTCVYLHLFWKKLFIDTKEIALHSWIPVLFYVITPVCFWAYNNHVEETVMAIFATMASYYVYCALFLKERPIFYFILGGVFIFLSGLTKGVQGMFPIAAVGIYWLLSKDISLGKMVLWTLFLIGVPTLILGTLWLSNEDVSASFISYYHDRYVPTFTNEMNTTGNRFDILIKVFLEILPIGIISGLILLFSRKYKTQDVQPIHYKKSMFWLFILGLSGTAPLMVTLEQRGFYIVTAMPLFVLAVSMLAASRITTLINRIKSMNTLNFGMAFLFACSIVLCFSQIGKFKRNENTLRDIYKVKQVIPENSLVGLPSKMHSEWAFRAYMMRYNKNSMKDNCSDCKYFVIYKNLDKNLVPPNYSKVNIESQSFDLYRIN